jgi:hypothetical protein
VPNLPAARDARGRSACYPRSTFYLLSDGPSMQDRRITNADFRPCSTDGSRSQAPLYVYARVARLPTGPRVPWRSSVTLWEETAPVKLPDEHGPDAGTTASVRTDDSPGWYFTGGSPPAGADGSQPPTYATQDGRPASANLQ